MVLCIGADGHVEVEAGHGGRCTSFLGVTPREASDFLPVYEVETTQDHCGQCLDLPIFISSSDGQYFLPIQQIEPQSSLGVITALISQSLCATITTENFVSYSPPLINPTLASLRTVTLLI